MREREMIRGEISPMVSVSSSVRIAALLVFILLLAGCIFSSDKKSGEDEKPPGTPAVTWISISEGDIIKTRNVYVSWIGNKYSLRYRFTLDSISSGWFDSTSFVLSNLANGSHVLSVQAANDSLTSEIKVVHFTVDTGVESGFYFSPDSLSVISFVSFFIENVSGIMAAHIEIASKDNCARLREFTPSVAASSGDIVLLSDSKDPYRFILDIGFPEEKGGFSGTLELGSFLVSPMYEGVVAIDTEKTIFRDTKNQTISLAKYESLRIRP